MKIPSQKETLESLIKTIYDLVPERDLDNLLERVIEVSTEILGADRALLYLFDKKSQGLVYKYGTNVEEGFIEVAHEFSSSIIERALKGEITITTDAQKDGSFFVSDSILKYDIKTILCAPIMSDGRLIGVIYADTKGKATILDEERKNYFISFVELISTVIAREQDLYDRKDELVYLKRRLTEETIFPEIVGESPVIKNVKESIIRIASVDYPVSVLILGESGSGKELIAQAIHRASPRAGKPFVIVNCAAIPVNLMESELFGHEKGAFTGAHSRKQGFFEVAHGGMIFLDEIGDLPLELQPKLLRVLQFGTFTRLGGRTELSTDVQVLCATSKDLYSEMEEGRFRKALFHRLAVEVVHVPPLRERRQDILLLATHFMREFSEKMGRPLSGIDTGAQRLLTNHDYSGNNVRELKNIIERAALKTEGKKITSKDIVFTDELLSSSVALRLSSDSEDAGDERLLQIDQELVGRLLEESKQIDELAKEERPYYRVNAVMERKLFLLALRMSDWKIKPAAHQLRIDHMGFRSKLGSILKELFEENEGDIGKIARKYRIPLTFLKSKLKFLCEKENI